MPMSGRPDNWLTGCQDVRDSQENQAVYARLEQARVDNILSEHDPFRAV